MSNSDDPPFITTPGAFLAHIGIRGHRAAALIAAQPYARVLPHHVGEDRICHACGLSGPDIDDAPFSLACLGGWIAVDPGDDRGGAGAEAGSLEARDDMLRGSEGRERLQLELGEMEERSKAILLAAISTRLAERGGTGRQGAEARKLIEAARRVPVAT